MKALAKRVSEVTKKHKFETALRFTITFIDGFNTLHSEMPKIGLEDFILSLSEYDRRFIEGVPKRKIYIPSNKFRDAGTVYIGKPETKQIIEEGDCGLLLTFNDGIFCK